MSARNPVWNPEQYFRFADERLQPAIDLMGRIVHPGPAVVVDLGCGAGNALPLLAGRFPGAAVSGVDGSTTMLARAAEGGFATRQADIATWRPDAPVDVLFSNAALQWLPAHETLFPRLLSQVAPGGVLAVQMPAMDATPARRLQREVAAEGPWATALAGATASPSILEMGAYYRLLRPMVKRLDLWFTEYVHLLKGPDPVMQWFMGSSLQPYVQALPEALRPAYLAAYADAVRPHYPAEADGTVLFPFRRFFLMASL
ncbi:MAG: Trans-aconitate methyltransferase [Roseomonas sp.]|nr:Trans-aconitate methyltransferase [Roseomonas sp.]